MDLKIDIQNDQEFRGQAKLFLNDDLAKKLKQGIELKVTQIPLKIVIGED